VVGDGGDGREKRCDRDASVALLRASTSEIPFSVTPLPQDSVSIKSLFQLWKAFARIFRREPATVYSTPRF
jgi:hypothetical protein